MERYLQMTFVPHIEKGWNFFIWVTGPEGQSVPFPGTKGSDIPAPNGFDGASYQMMPTTAEFVNDRGTTSVSGLLLTMESAFRFFQENRLEEQKGTEILAGETLQWFAQIAQAVSHLLASGQFYPYLYHMERGNHEWCAFCQWMPEGRNLVKSGLFARWLSSLPPLAFAIADLQDQKVQQWLYLIIIYWTNALIRYRLADQSVNPAFGSLTLPRTDIQSTLGASDPFSYAEKPWMIARSSGDKEEMQQLESEWLAWIKPAIRAEDESWIQALLSYKKEKMADYFAPERAQILLTPENEEEPFSPSSDWMFEINVTGWQDGRKVQWPLDQLQRSALLGRNHWFDERLNSLSEVLPAKILARFSAKSSGTLSASELGDLFQNKEAMENASLDLEFPEDLKMTGSTEPLSLDLDLTTTDADSQSLFSLNSLINYNWQIAIGDIQLSAETFRQLVRENQSFIRHGDQWVHLPMQEMRKAYAEMDQTLDLLDKKPSIAGSLRLTALNQRKRKSRLAIHMNAELSDYLDHLMKKPAKSAELPSTFTGKLRPYQKKGYTWLVNLRRRHVGGCLADDMGLGKTVQAIAYLDYCQTAADSHGSSAPALIICPTSLVANWHHEFSAFSPETAVYIHHGSNRLHGKRLIDEFKKVDVVITSYAIYTKEAAILQPVRWQSVILDEAQAIKNPQAQKTRALRKIQSDHRLVLTGTPIENHLEELWSIMDFINPGYLGSLERFRKQFIHPIERKSNRGKAAELTKLIQPFLLRREKTDKRIIRDLPDKFEEKRLCHLTKEQASLYQSIVNRLASSVIRAQGIRRKGLILSTLTKLKQVCDHPSLVSKQAEKESTSGKMQLFFNLLDPLFAENQKVLVFTQYVRMGQLLLEKTHERYPDADVFFLHGGLSADQRERLIEHFQSKTVRKTLFILSLKAGGVGINLTEAGYVVHYDRWWNPAVEEQATDRAYRIGQNKNVHVYKLICEGTLEERIDQLIDRKKNLQKQILSQGNSWLTEMTDQEIFQLIQLREGVI
ncbi:MAG: DEAD/DEAH box helicase [Sporolactobacillus sp.]